MQSLLRWGIENSSSNADSSAAPSVPARRMTDLDPGVIDAILGRPDSELMKEALAKAQDASLDEDARLTALDDLEMLVENIDNANDLEKLGMWEPLQGLLGSPSDDVRVQALWVIGTAVQNNPSAQRAYLALEPFQALLDFLSPSSRAPAQLRSKAIYALSGVLKHHAAALAPFEAAGGWAALRGALSDSDIGVRRKTAFLLNTLLLSEDTTTSIRAGSGGTDSEAGAGPRVHPNSHAALVADPSSADTARATLRALRTDGLLPALVRELTVPTPHGPDGEEGGSCDADFEEKLVRLLHTYVAVHGGTFDVPEKHALKAFLATKRAGQSEGGGELGLGADELGVFESALA
ncbi:nucleotide exchange factors-like protein [Lactarius akahatsu]|uniref:Nucleotide exchange factors-like protein n=1 Tax=Lactarius akahatsu TaxID=416441 RepID=A0AAD4LE45_9AGAM|nr:nucleotide exchange factors-like protein [Lactarius akahatsu]